MFIEINDKIALLLIVLFGCLLRLTYVLSVPDKLLWPDERDFYQLSENLHKGTGYVLNDRLTAFRAPGYPLFLTGLRMTGIRTVLGIKIVQVILSSLIIYIVYQYASVLFDKKIALLSACLTAIYPYFVFIPSTLLATTFFSLILVLGTYVLHLAQKHSKNWLLILSGILFGILVLTRPVALALLPVVIIWFYFKIRTKFLLYTILFMVPVLLTISPWVIRNKTTMNINGLVTNGGYNLWIGNNPNSSPNHGMGQIEFPTAIDNHIKKGTSEKIIDQMFKKKAVKYITRHPEIFIKRFFLKIIYFWRFDPSPTTGTFQEKKAYLRWISILSFGPAFFLSILGFILASKEDKSKFMLWLGYAIFYTVVHALFFVKVRFRLPLDHFLLVSAAFSMVLYYHKFIGLFNLNRIEPESN